VVWNVWAVFGKMESGSNVSKSGMGGYFASSQLVGRFYIYFSERKGGNMKRMHDNISTGNDMRGDLRNQIEKLRHRVDLLDGKDKVLMQMYLEKGSSYCQLAKLMDVYPSTVVRRIRKIVKRLVSGKYIVCLKNRELFNDFEMMVAKKYFLNGYSIKKIATDDEHSFYQVYQAIGRIKIVTSMIDSNKSTERSVKLA